MPLRSSNIKQENLKKIIIVGNLEYVAREWMNIMNFPEVYVMSMDFLAVDNNNIQLSSPYKGNPLNRAYLRAANIFNCCMCVILTGSKRAEDAALADKEAILCTLNIKTMPKDIKAIDDWSRTSDFPGQNVPTITELTYDDNVQYLEQDDDSETCDIFMSQPYACGRVFSTTLLDSIMSTITVEYLNRKKVTYHNRQGLAFLRALVTGGVTVEVEQIYAEGFGLMSAHADKSYKRNRSRIVQYSLGYDPIFTGFRTQQKDSYGDLFMYMLKNFGIVIIGVYRLLYPDNTKSTKRYVVTNPPKGYPLKESDMIYCVEPFKLVKVEGDILTTKM